MRRLHAVAGLVVMALAASVPTARSAPSSYRVKEGDTLARIARRTGVPVEAIAEANKIANPDHIRIGQVLRIPKVGEPAPVAPAPLPPLPSPLVIVGADHVHKVETGQTLGAIARQYGTTVAALAQANALRNPNLIRIGADLLVPGPPWLCPVAGPRQFSDSWGQPREGGRRHLGVDMFAARGTAVVASVGGTVTHANGVVAGNAFYLKGDDGNVYYGAHLDTLGPDGRVERGAQLGTVGSTGNAKGTTPHLHFEIKPGGGDPVNPFPSLQRWCA